MIVEPQMNTDQRGSNEITENVVGCACNLRKAGLKVDSQFDGVPLAFGTPRVQIKQVIP